MRAILGHLPCGTCLDVFLSQGGELLHPLRLHQLGVTVTPLARKARWPCTVCSAPLTYQSDVRSGLHGNHGPSTTIIATRPCQEAHSDNWSEKCKDPAILYCPLRWLGVYGVYSCGWLLRASLQIHFRQLSHLAGLNTGLVAAVADGDGAHTCKLLQEPKFKVLTNSIVR